MLVTKDTIIGAVIDFDPNAAKIFHMNGMFCTGCPHARSESIGDACKAHGVDADELIKALNEYFGKLLVARLTNDSCLALTT